MGGATQLFVHTPLVKSLAGVLLHPEARWLRGWDGRGTPER